MDFGQLSPHRHFDSRLPQRRTLKFEPTSQSVRIHIGAPQWNVSRWLGKIYPRGLKAADFLPHYARHWNSIELNSSFYKIPNPSQIENWAKKTPEDFKFFVKVYQGISHDPLAWADLNTLRFRIDEFTQSWSTLRGQLGGYFLQLPPHFSLERLALFERWLSCWPKNVPLFVEFRHTSWFENRLIIPRVETLLRTKSIGTVITDTPGRRDASHGSITQPRLLIRFLSQSSPENTELLPLDIERIKNWADWIAEAVNDGVSDVSFFIHAPEEFWVPELTQVFIDQLRSKIPTSPLLHLNPPVIIQEPQLSLF